MGFLRIGLVGGLLVCVPLSVRKELSLLSSLAKSCVRTVPGVASMPNCPGRNCQRYEAIVPTTGWYVPTGRLFGGGMWC